MLKRTSDVAYMAHVYHSYFLKFYLFWLHWVFVASCRLSLLADSRVCSLVVVCGLLIVMVFLVAEHGL